MSVKKYTYFFFCSWLFPEVGFHLLLLFLILDFKDGAHLFSPLTQHLEMGLCRLNAVNQAPEELSLLAPTMGVGFAPKYLSLYLNFLCVKRLMANNYQAL